jgi:quinolinate synthase
VVVSYVNTTAATKAVSDYCCTSANAVKVVNAVPAEKEIIFTPDRNLGSYVQRVTGRELIIWPGCCPTHERITLEMVVAARKAHPAAEVVVHPECRPEVVAAADAVKSTSGMLTYCAQSPGREFIIGTEEGMLYPLRKACPEKKFWPVARGVICPNMKRTTLRSVRDALRLRRHEIVVAADVADDARRAIERMLAVGRDAGG